MSTQKAEDGHTVKVHYTVREEEDSIHETSKDKQPIQFTIGGGNVISGLEKGVVGMAVGESKTLTVPPEEAFGVMREELITSIKKDNLPEGITPQIGKVLELKRPSGQNMRLKITDVQEDSVTLDANHPLAGRTFQLDVQMVEIMR